MTNAFDIQKYDIASYSSLKHIREEKGSPANFLWKKTSRDEDKQESEALLMGKLCDCLLFKPDEFKERFAIVDQVPDTSTNDYKFCEAYSGYIAKGFQPEKSAILAKTDTEHRFKVDTLLAKLENGWGKHLDYIKVAGKEILSTERYDRAQRLIELVRNNEEIMDILDSCDLIQPWIEWENKASGQMLKGEMDAGRTDEFSLDLKALHDVSPFAVIRPWYGKAWSEYYHSQQAGYQEGLGMPQEQGYLLCLQTQGPLQIAMYEFNSLHLEQGLEELNKWATHFKHCRENDLWHMGPEYYHKYAIEVDDFGKWTVKGSEFVSCIIGAESLERW